MLDVDDLRSPTWAKLKKHFEQRRNDHRIENEKRLSDLDTAYLRGRIAEETYLLDLAGITPKPE